MEQNVYQLNDCSKPNIRYNSNNSDIVDVNNQAIIKVSRLGKAIISSTGLNNKDISIKITSSAEYGLINKYTLDIKNSN